MRETKEGRKSIEPCYAFCEGVHGVLREFGKQPGKVVGILHYMAFRDYRGYTKYSACKKRGEKIVVRVSQGIAEECGERSG